MNVLDMIRSKISGRNAGSISINGRSYSGNNITISAGGIVTVDGIVQSGAALVGPITVNITGDMEHVSNTSGDINITGDANIVMTTSGDVRVKGDVKKDASSTSGDITCSEIHGDASTVSGDISKKFFK
jgi:hypothetical protein